MQTEKSCQKPLYVHKSALIALCLLLPVFAAAQSSKSTVTSNEDILKMIQGGLPESVILNKIHTSAGQLDTSVDALLALKRAGATEAELAAMTAPPAEDASSRPQPAVLGASEPVEAFGAQLLRTRAGDPYLRFPSASPGVFPNGLESNTAYLVRYKGEVGILVPATRFFGFQADCMVFNAIFLHDKLVVDRYLDFSCSGKGGIPGKLLKDGNGIDEFSRTGLSLSEDKGFSVMSDDNPPRQAGLRYRNLVYTDGGKKPIMKDRVVFGVFPFNYGYESHSDQMYSPLLDPFIDQLFSRFDATVASFEKAAGLTDPLKQLSPQATYTSVTMDQATEFQTKMDQRWRMRPKGHGFSVMDLVQGYNTTQQMTSGLMNSAVGVSKGNTAQLTAGLQNMGAASGSSTYTNIANNLNGSQPALTGQSAADTVAASSAAGGGRYTGPNAQWVHMVLATAGPYSCTPAGKVKVPSQFTCQRDGEIYKAQTLAWASECSEQTGFHDDAVKDANILLDTLKVAKDLCGAQAPTGPVKCDTDTVLSCSQLPN